MKRIIVSLILLCQGLWAFSQNAIELQIEILPPYPVNLEYYLNNADNAFVSVTNTTATDQEIFFHTRISSNTGMLAQTIQGYRPAQPFLVPAFSTVVLTGQDLENTDFGFNSFNEVDISGVTQEQRDQIIFDRALPEGTYEVCILAYGWISGAPIGFNCSTPFDILYGDMPVIVLPTHEEEVEATDNSFLFIFWEPPFTNNPVPGNFEYRLKMIDITDQPFNDLEILMNDPGQFPILDEEGILDNVFNYQYPDQIELIEGHQYALRVQAVDPTGTTPVTNNGYSEITTFWYGFRPDDGSGGNLPPEGEVASDCSEDCLFGPINNQTPVASIASFATLEIGYFTLEIESVSNESGNQAAGTGSITIPFLDSVQVNVTFEDVKVNANGRIYEGNVYAAKDYDYDPNDPVSVSNLDRFLRTERLISTLLGGRGRALNMPVGIVWDINGEHLMLGFNDMTFTPERASCQVMYNMHYPHWGDFWLSLSASDICLLPVGFGEEFILHPVVDVDLPDIGDTRYSLKGSAATTAAQILEEATYVQVDCKGILDFGLNIEVQFSRDVIVPDTETGEPGNGWVSGRLTASFPRAADAPALGTGADAAIGFLGQLSIDSFQIRGLPGLGFTLQEGWVDFSDTRNPPNMTLPVNYEDDNVISANGTRTLDPLWEGYYMKSLSVRSAQGWLFEGQRFQFEVSDMILDDVLTMNVQASNIADGDIANWYLSLDTISLELVQWSANNTGTWNVGLNGRIGMPITAANQFLQYSAFILPQDEGRVPNMEFLVQPPQGLTFPFMQTAFASLCPNSYVRVVQENGTTFFDSQLAGNMGVTFSEPVTVTIPWVDFQFGYHSANGFSNQAFSILGQTVNGQEVSCENLPPLNSLANGGGNAGNGANSNAATGSSGFPSGTPVSANNFPMSIDLLDILQVGGIGQVDFQINPRIELGGGGQSGFGADLDLAIQSRMNAQSKKLEFDGIDLGRIQVNVDEVFGLSINGEIEFYQEQNDRGARGELFIALPMGISTDLKADFGVRANRIDVPFGTEDYFGYWYVDGMVGFPGVPIAPGVSLHGLGGGVYVNMRRQDSFDNANAEAVQDLVNDLMDDIPNTEFSVASTPDVLRPVVEYGQFGLKLATRLATQVPSALNMDVSIAGGFAPGIGINNLSVQGDAYLMTPIENRSRNSNFWASAGFSWNKDGSGHRFSGGIDLFANVGNGLLRGVGPGDLVIGANFLADSDGTWYFHAGNPTLRAGLEVDVVIAQLEALGYFMVGHGIPATLPMPDKVHSLIGKSSSRDGNRLENQNPVTGERIREGSYEDAKGIAFGFETSTTVDIRAWALYAKLETVMGFDINLTEQLGSTCYIPNEGMVEPGVNGWYATGQIYAGMEGAMGLKGRFLGKEREFELFQMAAAMLLNAGAPNPTWAEGRAGASYRVLNGLIKGSVNFDIRAGDRCVPDSDDENLIPVIYELSPEEGEENVSIFASSDLLATFLLPINEEITVPIVHPITRETENVKLEIFIDTLYVRNDQSGQVWQGTRRWSEDKKAVTLNIGSAFAPETPHSIHLKVKAWQHLGSNKIPLIADPINNTPWEEERIHSFTTGETPYPVPDDQVLKTLPIRNQRYFMQNAVMPNYLVEAPLILFNMNMASAGYFPASEGDYDYEYYFRWASLDGNDPIVIDANHLAGQNPVQLVMSRIPRLENDTYYSCQLVRKTIRYRTVTLPNGTTMRMRVGTEGLGISDRIIQVAGAEFDGTGMSRADTLQVDINIDPGQFVGAGEEIIYQFYFKTSKFNSLSAKMANATIAVEEGTHSLSKYPILRFEMEENFDVFDIEGEYNQQYGGYVSHPRVEFSSVIGAFQPTYRSELVASVNPSGYGTVVDAWVQDDYQHQGNQGKAGYASYLSQSLVGFLQLYEQAKAQSHDIILSYGTEPPRTISTDFPENHPSLLRGDYLGANHTFYMRDRRAAGYDPPLSPEEIQNTWESHVNTNVLLKRDKLSPLSDPLQGGWESEFLDIATATPGKSAFTLEYYVPVWVAQDIQDVTAFGAELLSLQFIWDAGSVGNMGPGGPGSGGNPPVISGSGGLEGGFGTEGIAQTTDPTAGGSGGSGGIVIVGGGGSHGGGEFVPPTLINMYEDYIHNFYPALQTQLDIMNDPRNFYRLEKHRGEYDIRLQPDIGYLIETRVPGLFTIRDFSYSLFSNADPAAAGLFLDESMEELLNQGPPGPIVEFFNQ